MTDPLRTYRQKRHFDRTPEPTGDRRSESTFPIYVIQEHDARAHHYDFRLEIDGVLKSWSVPKGPSLDPTVKRLAIETEDHPMDYADFEGTIPKGEYGGGPVIVWDRGVFQNLSSKSLSEGYRHGHLSFWLQGLKLAGGFSLTRIAEEAGKAHWVLVKRNDEAADPRRNIVHERPESAMTGRTIEDVRGNDERGAAWLPKPSSSKGGEARRPLQASRKRHEMGRYYI